MNVAELNFISHAKELITIKEKIKYLQQEEKRVTQDLKDICHNESFSCEGYTFEKIERAGLIQYKDIPQLDSVNLELYRSEPIESWKISYVKQFEI